MLNTHCSNLSPNFEKAVSCWKAITNALLNLIFKIEEASSSARVTSIESYKQELVSELVNDKDRQCIIGESGQFRFLNFA